jgi:hypothetical protein
VTSRPTVKLGPSCSSQFGNVTCRPDRFGARRRERIILRRGGGYGTLLGMGEGFRFLPSAEPPSEQALFDAMAAAIRYPQGLGDAHDEPDTGKPPCDFCRRTVPCECGGEICMCTCGRCMAPL